MVRKRAVEGFGLLLSYLAASCGSCPSVDPRPVSACDVPTSRVAFDSTTVEQLAGEYRLIFVSDSYPAPGATRAAALHLEVIRDTLYRLYRYSSITGKWHRFGERPLRGWLTGPLKEVGAVWSGNAGSEDPAAPGLYYEQAYDEFIVGDVSELLYGASTKMQVLWTVGRDFGGRWKPELTLTVYDRATGRRLTFGGRFCAVRQ
jgi:hypothetical protein